MGMNRRGEELMKRIADRIAHLHWHSQSDAIVMYIQTMSDKDLTDLFDDIAKDRPY